MKWFVYAERKNTQFKNWMPTVTSILCIRRRDINPIHEGQVVPFFEQKMPPPRIKDQRFPKYFNGNISSFVVPQIEERSSKKGPRRHILANRSNNCPPLHIPRSQNLLYQLAQRPKRRLKMSAEDNLRRQIPRKTKKYCTAVIIKAIFWLKAIAKGFWYRGEGDAKSSAI